MIAGLVIYVIKPLQVSPEFSNQILNCVNTLICHGINDEDSAETVARWIGTHDVFDVTAQVDMNKGGTGLGSVSRNKEFLIHPDQLKRELAPGDAFYISKVGGFRMDKVKVKFS
jgi:type IV secretory pathway TraG/TraD family ATPase VirD4